jgi:hypothetical protein
MITSPLRAAAPFALLSLLLTACGGSALTGAARPPEALPETTEGTLDVLDRAENDLRLALGGMAAPAPSAAPRAEPLGGIKSPAQPPPPPSAPVTLQGEASPRDEQRSSVASGPTALSTSDPCANACRALASMERATSHLCSLAGDADARCEGARARVKNAGARVHAECPACAGG